MVALNQRRGGRVSSILVTLSELSEQILRGGSNHGVHLGGHLYDSCSEGSTKVFNVYLQYQTGSTSSNLLRGSTVRYSTQERRIE